MPSEALRPRVAAARRAFSAAVVALVWLGAAWGQQTSAPGRHATSERQGIEDERERIEAAYAAELARCNERFAVTACVDHARQRRRAALAGPRARELALDDAERRSRAAARRQAVKDKQIRAAQGASAPRFEIASGAAAREAASAASR